MPSILVNKKFKKSNQSFVGNIILQMYSDLQYLKYNMKKCQNFDGSIDIDKFVKMRKCGECVYFFFVEFFVNDYFRCNNKDLQQICNVVGFPIQTIIEDVNYIFSDIDIDRAINDFCKYVSNLQNYSTKRKILEIINE